jgi:hypothetical protein
VGEIVSNSVRLAGYPKGDDVHVQIVSEGEDVHHDHVVAGVFAAALVDRPHRRLTVHDGEQNLRRRTLQAGGTVHHLMQGVLHGLELADVRVSGHAAQFPGHRSVQVVHLSAVPVEIADSVRATAIALKK